MRYTLVGITFLIGLLGFITSCSDQQRNGSMTRSAIEERIEPLGEVTVSEDSSEESGTKGVASGKSIFNQYCVNCHALKPKLPVGAPRFRIADEWRPRLKTGMDTILTKVIKGFKAMPAKGTCFDCTDKELLAAIKYMIPKKKK